MKAKDIMVPDVPMISRKAPVAEAVRILRKNFGDESFLNAAPGLVVVNDTGELAGILSPLSVIRALLTKSESLEIPSDPNDEFFATLCSSLQQKRVEDVMDWQPIWVTEDANLMELAKLFAAHMFQRLPVVSDGKVIGIIYRSRLLFAMSKSLL
jgi:CBS domain-containing protein